MDPPALVFESIHISFYLFRYMLKASVEMTKVLSHVNIRVRPT